MHIHFLRQTHDHHEDIAAMHCIRPGKPSFGIQTRLTMQAFLIIAFLAGIPFVVGAQTVPDAVNSSNTSISKSSGQFDSDYLRPTEEAKFRNYVFDAVGPYPIVIAGFVSGVNQLTNSPPEWHQGAEGYGKRFGSNFGIAITSTTTRYALSEALKEDELYYPCECQGVIPRLRHAAFSTLMARRGNNGHRVFSIPALVAPYAGTMTAVYGWYPDRYGAKDAFRMGNYSLLGYVGGNIAMEFLNNGPHSLFSRMHLGRMHKASGIGSTN